MASFRATATISMRLLRPPAGPTRVRNHCVKALVGHRKTEIYWTKVCLEVDISGLLRDQPMTMRRAND
jgi:hypothetical protein